MNFIKRNFAHYSIVFISLLTLSKVNATQTILAAESQTTNINQVSIQSEFQQGMDYWVINSTIEDNINDLNKLKVIADIELFYWFGCEPCKKVEQVLTNYKQQNPDLIIRYTPLVAHSDWRQQAYIQPLLEQLVELENLPDRQKIYESCLIEDCATLASFDLINQWLLKYLQLEQLPPIDTAKIWQAEKEYRKRADSFSISQVPTIIIRENYAVDANSAKSLHRLMAIVDFLLQETR
ncbi:hypothetical protein [Aliikangiella maris]|uniref:Uncharacterized protein n=2 Tax=Aliikangiella maris TaxID=3162458 RepID=A0ABV3MNG6_9GAMM